VGIAISTLQFQLDEDDFVWYATRSLRVQEGEESCSLTYATPYARYGTIAGSP
jgi:hypothetical protein